MDQMCELDLSSFMSVVETVNATDLPSGAHCGSPTFFIFARSSSASDRFALCAGSRTTHDTTMARATEQRVKNSRMANSWSGSVVRLDIQRRSFLHRARWSHGLDRHGDAHTAADAQRRDAVSRLSRAKLVQQRGQHARPARTDRVSE